MKYSDEDLLKIVGEERKRSIGFGEGDTGELTTAREKALKYAKGEMSDVPALPNRSKAVDTTVADAIETVLPDVMEVFVGGEDVATFVPQGAQDEDSAQEETDFVNHVIYTENEGFLNLYSAIKDALLTRTGILHWWWDEEEKSETFAEGLDEQTAAVGQQMQPGLEAEKGEDGVFSLTSSKLHGKVCIRAVPSEDFTVAPDTVSLRDTTYCAMRTRLRVQELIARGIPAELARQLKGYTHQSGNVEQDRDHAGEQNIHVDGAGGDLRQVEARVHFIRLAGEDGKLEVWRVITDSEETKLLDKDMVGQIPFAAGTPYIVPHRFYGESVADKLIEVQKIKTALLRMLLDSGYFALNQRNYVDMTKANEFTIADLLRNEPGIPVRGNGEGAVTPIAAGNLNFDVFSAMEYISTMAESRSGIVRNAQGLNPDTLHDTAKGAMALIAAAQKRVRMIARVFAETMVKDLVLGVHCMLREYSSADHAPYSAKLRNQWKEIKPAEWPERCAMTVHVGVGSAGKEHDLAIANQRLELMQSAIQLQGGLEGPILDAANLHEALEEWERAAGSKKASVLWSDPADPNAPKPQPKPDPEMMKAQGQLALQREKAAADVQTSREKAQADAQATAAKHQIDAEAAERQAERNHELKLHEITTTGELKRYQIDLEIQLRREEQAANVELERERMALQQQTDREANSLRETQAGGEPG